MIVQIDFKILVVPPARALFTVYPFMCDPMTTDLLDIWVERTRMDIMHNSITFFPLQNLNTPILKPSQTKVKSSSALFGL